MILDILDKINEGDYLMYCDAGCHINKNAKNKFFEYTKIVEKYNFHVAEGTGYPEFEWSKMDLIDLLKPTQEQLKADQIMATHIFLIKNEYTYNLIKKWNNLMSIENLHYFDDSPSILPNIDGFKESRHDQSVLSLLLKTGGGIMPPRL